MASRVECQECGAPKGMLHFPYCSESTVLGKHRPKSNPWNSRFIHLAQHIAQWSKDPSTKTGAVIVDPKRRIVSVGYNGFPAGVEDRIERYQDRITKYKYIVHADMNAVLFAERDLGNCTIYTWPFMPCAACAGVIIQSGINGVYYPNCLPELATRWATDMEVAKQMFKEARIHTEEMEVF